MISKVPKRRARESLPALKRKAWTILSRVVRRFHAEHCGLAQCVTCRRWYRWQELDAGHFISKNKGGRLWFEWRNCHPQCTHCNRYLHGHPVAYTLAMIERYGLDEVQRLQGLVGPYKRTRADYRELIEHLKACEAEL